MSNSFFHLKLKFSLLCSWLCLVVGISAQTVDTADVAQMPRRAMGLISSDSALARQAFQLIPKDDKAYIAIHGQGKVFRIIVDNTWKTITHRSLAKWISDNPIYNGKNIVLLSCSDKNSTQKLANSLGLLDKAAKRPVRKVIGWDYNVVLYSNGYIRGYGLCRSFSPQAGVTPPIAPDILLDANVPKGTNLAPTPRTTYVLLSSASAGYTQAELEAIYATLPPNSSDNWIPLTAEHKADRWMQHLAKGGTTRFSTWSAKYEANMRKPQNANSAVEEYAETLSWNQDARREYYITVTLPDGSTAVRKIDLADPSRKIGIEVKAYDEEVVYLRNFLQKEIEKDKVLIGQGWHITWVFMRCRASGPLQTELQNAGVDIELYED
jgi:hypothetical protein